MRSRRRPRVRAMVTQAPPLRLRPTRPAQQAKMRHPRRPQVDQRRQLRLLHQPHLLLPPRRNSPETHSEACSFEIPLPATGPAQLIFAGGTFLPALRASDRPMAMACFGFVTFLPLLPLFSLPCFIAFISRSTLLPAAGLYFRVECFFALFFAEVFFADFFAAFLVAMDLPPYLWKHHAPRQLHKQ